MATTRPRTVPPAPTLVAHAPMLVLLLPFTTYLAARGNRKLWYGCAALLALGAISTVSRTAIMMLVVEGIVFLRLRPVETRRLWPLVVPLLIAVHLAVPGPDIHAEESHSVLYAALDLVTAKLARQLRKRKTRLTDKVRSKTARSPRAAKVRRT